MRNTILLVDDDLEMCAEISEALRDEGYDVSVVNDGLEGYAHIRDNNYDLVLLDVRLPGMNGLDILKGVREMKKQVHIIAVTGMPIDGDVIKSDNGALAKRNDLLRLADGVLSKPFEMAKLLKAVKSAMNRP